MASLIALDASAEYRRVIGTLLESESRYDIELCDSFADLDRRLGDGQPDLLIVNYADVPEGEDGLVSLRQAVDCPIMALVCSTEESKAALRSGADYDLPKPFDPEVFTVAVDAVMRRGGGGGGTVALLPLHEPIVLEDLRIYPDRRTVERNGRRQQLSPTEWSLFAFLLAHPGRVFSRRELAAGAWGPGYASRADQAELYISRVRRRIERDVRRPALIETVRGRGYRLVAGGLAPAAARGG